METKELLDWSAQNHEFVTTLFIAALIGACSVVHSFFKFWRDIIYAITGVKRKEPSTFSYTGKSVDEDGN